MRAPQVGFAQLVQDFFLRRLIAQRGASARTVESYRDAFELLFGFIEQSTGKPAAALQLADLDAPVVLDFLDHLEARRGNSVRTRNARLAAIHSFMRYAAVRDPASLPVAGRVLAIPAKRFDRPVLGYLSREQIAAILAAPDRRTWSGQRDAVMLATTYNTGARVSEITALQRRNVLLDRQAAVHLHGKGRKERVIPFGRTPPPACELGWQDQRRPRRAGVPQPVRGSDVPLRSAGPARSGRRGRRTGVPIAARPAHLTAHAAPLHRHAPTAVGHRPGDHRLVARTFQPSRHPSVPRSRPRRQGSRAAPPRRSQSRSDTIPARRPAPRLPARPVIMRSRTTGNRHAKQGPPTGLHITRG